MRFSCDGSALGKALRVASAVTQSRPDSPVMACVRLDAANEKLAITATNRDIQVTVRLDATVLNEGCALVNSNVLRGLARQGNSEFKTDGTDLVFKGPLSSARLQTIPTEDFPTLSSKGDFKEVKSSAADILDCMKFAADEEVRFFLRGVCIGPDHCVATDGHRILAIEGGGGAGQIIPKEAAAVLAAMTEASIQLSDCMWKARTETTTAYGRLIDGIFPEWEHLIPSLTPTLDVQADDLAAAVTAISPVISEKVRKISVCEQNGTLCLSANGGFGAASAKATSTGTLGEVGINGKYLESVCTAFSGRTLGVVSSNEALKFSAGRRRAVVMGMR